MEALHFVKELLEVILLVSAAALILLWYLAQIEGG